MNFNLSLVISEEASRSRDETGGCPKTGSSKYKRAGACRPSVYHVEDTAVRDVLTNGQSWTRRFLRSRPTKSKKWPMLKKVDPAPDDNRDASARTPESIAYRRAAASVPAACA